MQLNISKEFTTAPGPRHISEGKFSGEQFRKEKLLPKLQAAVAQKEKLTVILDGASGYGTSFLEESFGGLIRLDGFPLAELRQVLHVVSEEEPDLLEEIEQDMIDAEKLRTAQGLKR